MWQPDGNNQPYLRRESFQKPSYSSVSLSDSHSRTVFHFHYLSDNQYIALFVTITLITLQILQVYISKSIWRIYLDI